MDLQQGRFRGECQCPDLEHVVDLVGVVHWYEGERQGGLEKEWSNEVQCRLLYCAVVGKVMGYEVVIAVKRREVRVAGVRRGLCKMCKMMAYAAVRAALGKVVGKEQIEMLNWSSVRCTLKEYAVLHTPYTRCAVVGKMVGKEKNEMGKVVATAKNEMLNWSSMRCTLKEYEMLEAPWTTRAMRLAVCFAVKDVSDLAGVWHRCHSAAIWCGMCHFE